MNNKCLLLKEDTKVYFSQNLDKVSVGEENITLNIVKFNNYQKESIQVLYKDILLGYFDGFSVELLEYINANKEYSLKLIISNIDLIDKCIYLKYYIYKTIN